MATGTVWVESLSDHKWFSLESLQLLPTAAPLLCGVEPKWGSMSLLVGSVFLEDYTGILFFIFVLLPWSDFRLLIKLKKIKPKETKRQ